MEGKQAVTGTELPSSLEELEDLPISLVRDVNHLEKQLICELTGTQLEAKTVCKAAVKSSITSPPCTGPKYSK